MIDDGGHWYLGDGTPCHKQPDGKNTTLRHARKQHLFPSVTTIKKVLHSAGLERWKQEQVSNFAYDNPHYTGETQAQYFGRVQKGAFKQVSDAADLGTDIHDAIEQHLVNGKRLSSQMMVYCSPALTWIKENVKEIVAVEKRLVNAEEGFAGTMDLAVILKNGKRGTFDWKSRKTSPKYKITNYADQPMQIAAYGKTEWGDSLEIGGNGYISTTEPGRFAMVEYGKAQLTREWDAFKHVCAIWRHFNKYDPRENLTNKQLTGKYEY